jgi:hypothetical protein
MILTQRELLRLSTKSETKTATNYYAHLDDGALYKAAHHTTELTKRRSGVFNNWRNPNYAKYDL